MLLPVWLAVRCPLCGRPPGASCPHAERRAVFGYYVHLLTLRRLATEAPMVTVNIDDGRMRGTWTAVEAAADVRLPPMTFERASDRRFTIVDPRIWRV